MAKRAKGGSGRKKTAAARRGAGDAASAKRKRAGAAKKLRAKTDDGAAPSNAKRKSRIEAKTPPAPRAIEPASPPPMQDTGISPIEWESSDGPAYGLHDSVVLDDFIADDAIEPDYTDSNEETCLEAPDSLHGTMHALAVARENEHRWLLMAALIKAESQLSEQRIEPRDEWVAPDADCELDLPPHGEAEVAQPAPLLLAVCAPSPQIASAHAPDRNAYLERARRAAQAQNLAPAAEKASVFAKLRENRATALSVGAGAVALVLFGGAVLAFNADGDARASVAREETAVAPIADSSGPARDYAAIYDASQRLFAEGRVEEGVSLLSRAAEGGLPLAQYRLSKRYERGEGVPRNLSLALAWAERAARAGNVRAMHDVGVYYARGEGVQRDEAAAFRWFREAAEFGVSDSQFNVGLLYEQGRGVAADPRAALFWFLVAARNQDADAIDRAVSVAATLAPEDVAQVRELARAFRRRTTIASANEETPG